MKYKPLTYAKRTLRDVEKDIVLNYKKALANIRVEMLKLETKLYGKETTLNEILKYNRFINLQDSINAELKKLGKANYSIINKTKRDVFAKTYTGTLKEFDINWGKVSSDFINISINKPISGASFADTMKYLTIDGLKKISSYITQGLIQGESIANISKRIKTGVNVNAKRALTIARTETLRAMSEAEEESFNKLKERGFNVRKVWRNAGDSRVRGNPFGKYPNSEANHWSIEGQEADNEGFFYVPTKDGPVKTLGPHQSGVPSVDINCRCDIDIENIED